MAVTADRVWAEDVLRMYVTSLYPAALRMTRNAPNAEDLVQETLAKAPGSRAGPASRWKAPRTDSYRDRFGGEPQARSGPAHTYSRRRIQARVAQPQTGGR